MRLQLLAVPLLVVLSLTPLLAAAQTGSIAFTNPRPGESFYDFGPFLISGTISPAPLLPDNVSIAVALQGSSSGPIDQQTVAVGAGGAFSYLAPLIGLFVSASGTYVISATDSYGATGTTTFKYDALCGDAVFVSFATANATWGPSGAAQGVSVPVSNGCWPETFQLTIYATLKSGTSTYVLEGGAAVAYNQTATVFLQDYLTNVPAGLYAVTFSAITTSNEAVSAPTTPISLTT
jgi:hypothetical protein